MTVWLRFWFNDEAFVLLTKFNTFWTKPLLALAAYMFESRFSTSTSVSFAIGPARVLLDGAVRRHVVVGHTSYQNALSHKRLGNKERGHVYVFYNIMFACVF